MLKYFLALSVAVLAVTIFLLKGSESNTEADKADIEKIVQGQELHDGFQKILSTSEPTGPETTGHLPPVEDFIAEDEAQDEEPNGEEDSLEPLHFDEDSGHSSKLDEIAKRDEKVKILINEIAADENRLAVFRDKGDIDLVEEVSNELRLKQERLSVLSQEIGDLHDNE